MATKSIKTKLPENKWEFGAFLIEHWIKFIIMIISIGLVIFFLQIKSVKVGDREIEKQTLGQTLKGVKK